MKLFEDLMDASAKFADKATKVASEAFEQTKVVAGEAMDKGKKKVNELSLENDLHKAHRQLGELYYIMRKTGEMNEELLTQYYNAVAEIEARLEALKLEDVNEADDFTVEEVKEDVSDFVEEVKEEAAEFVEEIKETFCDKEPAVKVCPACGASADDIDVFCRECGNKLG